MKMLLIIFSFCSSLAFADYLYQPSNICIKDYYFYNGSFYYVRSDTGATVSVTTKNLGDDIFSGYDYNTTTKECSPKSSNNDLGMRDEDFNLLNALIAALMFALLAWSIL